MARTGGPGASLLIGREEAELVALAEVEVSVLPPWLLSRYRNSCYGNNRLCSTGGGCGGLPEGLGHIPGSGTPDRGHGEGPAFGAQALNPAMRLSSWVPGPALSPR